jgi:tetratricopeptide (TPR) repeat protein
MVSGPRSDTVGFSLGVSPVQYAMNQCMMIVKYLGLAFWPHPLVLDYGPPTALSIGDVALCGTVVAVLLLATLVTFICRPTIGFLGVWFFMILGPTSSFIPIVTEVGGERRMYLPLAGLVTLIVIALHWLLEQAMARTFAPRYAVLRTLVRGVPVVAGAAILGWISVVRADDYRSPESIWRAVVNGRPQNARAHYNLGNELRSAGKLHEAIEEYTDAVRIKPDYAQAHYNLGKTLRKLGMLDGAISHYWEAVRFGRGFANANFELGIVLNEQGKVDEAIYQYREALRLEPDHADAHVNLGNILRFQGNPQEAVDHFRAALRVRPDHVYALLNLGNVLVAMGQFDEGLANLREAARVKADWPAPFNRLGWILATHPDARVRDPVQAIQYARRASELSWRRDPVILDTLAAAYAAAGDFDQAISTAEASLALLSGTQSKKRADAIRERLQLYKLGQPYREPPAGQ